MKKQMKQGFTLVEIMIVVAIIGLLAAIAIPSFIKSRNQAQANSCVAGLKQIESAMEQWLMTTNANAATLVLDSNASNAVLSLIKTMPVCKAGGTYTFGSPVATNPPVCSIGTNITGVVHALPQ